MIIFRIALTVFALALIFFGVIMMIAPTPFGFVFLILGFLLLATVAPSFIRGLRRRWRWFDRRLQALEKRSPRWIAKILRRTAPRREEDDPHKDRASAKR